MNRRYLSNGIWPHYDRDWAKAWWKRQKQINKQQQTTNRRNKPNQSKTKQIKTKQTHSFIKTIAVSKEGSLGITSARALHTRGRKVVAIKCFLTGKKEYGMGQQGNLQSENATSYKCSRKKKCSKNCGKE